jgi:hypothetical protein
MVAAGLLARTGKGGNKADPVRYWLPETVPVEETAAVNPTEDSNPAASLPEERRRPTAPAGKTAATDSIADARA